MTKSKLEKAKEYAMSRTYPRFDSIFISNFVHREIEGAYLEGSKETENLEHQIKNVQRALNKWVDKAQNLEKKNAELEREIKKLIDFVLSKIDCCDVCPETDTCTNSEGTCPYAGILTKGEEEVTRKWLIQFILRG